MRRGVEKIEELDGKRLRIAVIVSRFNPRITEKLLEGAVSGLKECRVEEKNILVLKVPGAFEIPQAAARVVKSYPIDSVICLGAVIRGGTPHFEYIAAETARGIMTVGLQSGVPLIFGVLTVNHLRQAVERSTGRDNKGREAAFAAVETGLLFKQIKKVIGKKYKKNGN